LVMIWLRGSDLVIRFWGIGDLVMRWLCLSKWFIYDRLI
jgi:hypothetical protein